jgi:hypothetical protein
MSKTSLTSICIAYAIMKHTSVACMLCQATQLLTSNLLTIYRSFRNVKPNYKEPGSSVSIVSLYGLVDLAIEVRTPAEAKGFFL